MVKSPATGDFFEVAGWRKPPGSTFEVAGWRKPPGSTPIVDDEQHVVIGYMGPFIAASPGSTISKATRPRSSRSRLRRLCSTRST